MGDKGDHGIAMENAQATDVTKACAEQRDAPRENYTIGTAIEDARWLRSTPDATLSAARAKQIIDTLLASLERSACYLKAMQKGEGVFVLQQSDRAAPDAIALWAVLARSHGCSPAKVADAYAIVASWRCQPLNATKWPV